MTIKSIAEIVRADQVTRAEYLPALLIEAWMDDADVSAESLPVCDWCAKAQAKAIEEDRQVPRMIRATHWVLELDAEGWQLWSRACDIHAQRVRSDLTASRILADDDPLAQTTTCGDCWADQGAAHLAGVRVPDRRTAVIRLWIAHRTGAKSEVDVCTEHALHRCGGWELLGDLLEASGVMA